MAAKVKFRATIGIAAGKHFLVGIEQAQAKKNTTTDLPTVRVRERKVISISMYPFGVLWSLMGHRGTIQLLP